MTENKQPVDWDTVIASALWDAVGQLRAMLRFHELDPATQQQWRATIKVAVEELRPYLRLPEREAAQPVEWDGPLHRWIDQHLYMHQHVTSGFVLKHEDVYELLKVASIKREPGWQPIDTAPKDKAILVSGGTYCRNSTPYPFESELKSVLIAYWDDREKCWEVPNTETQDYDADVVRPTHWMPLPAPPEDDA